ncbi:hypothetical protein [Dactylosporangium sp. CA-139066]|uniref:hypothetical protein n=1 Tax=Dactylosporangium sp. CA-139066 TaxID=3239930 RepID=UPI003D8DBDE3
MTTAEIEQVQHALRAAMIAAVITFQPAAVACSLGHAETHPGRGYFLSSVTLPNDTVLTEDDELGWPLVLTVALTSEHILHNGVLHGDAYGAEITIPAATP